jgi:Vitamin B6 photo-protection and homoeostasis
MLVGSIVVSRVSSQAATWTAMITLLAIHLGMNYLAVRSVSMRTLNRQRTNLVFSTLYQKLPQTKESKTREIREIFPSPDEISLQERIFERDGVLRWQGGKALGYCQIGVPLRIILNHFSTEDKITSSYTGANSQSIAKFLDIFQDEGYFMWYDGTRRRFLICLKFPSDTETQIRAWMHALFMVTQIESGLEGSSVIDFIYNTKEEFRSWMERYKVLENLRRAGWDLDTAALETRSGTRIRTRHDGSQSELDGPWKF